MNSRALGGFSGAGGISRSASLLAAQLLRSGRMSTLGVALDGTETSSAVLQTAAPLARALKASIRLVSVVERPDLSGERMQRLERVADDLRGKEVPCSVELRVGRPAEEILAFARDRRPALLALVTHGRRGLERLRLGSVAEEVVRHADVPLLVVRPETAGARGQSILVALDGSPRAEEILPDVARLAKATGRAVDVVSVTLPAVTAGGLGEFPMYFPKDDPTSYLQGVCARLGDKGVKARPVALAGRAAPELLAYAAEAGAALIALTTHGRTGLRRALMGSIAEEILRNAPCPVLVRRTSGG